MSSKVYSLLAVIFAMLGLFFITSGTSYAFFTSSVASKDFVMTTGNLKLDYSKIGDSINLTNTYPLNNNDGLKTDGYSFSITNSGSVATKYQIRLEVSDDSTMPMEYIKLSWVKTKENSVNKSSDLSDPILLSELNATKTFIKDQIIASKKIDNYTLKLWIDFSAPNDIQGKTFKAKVVVDAIQNVEDGYVFDDTKPIITLNKYSDGNTDVSLKLNDYFTDPGVQSINDDKDLLSNSDVVVTYDYTNDGNSISKVDGVDTSKTGVYYINYTVTDSASNVVTAVRVVTVNNTLEKPSIKLIGASKYVMYRGKTFNDPGVKDVADNNHVGVIGDIVTTVADTYIIRYIVVDQNGSINSVTREVIVKPDLFLTDSWATIVTNIRAGKGDLYAPVSGGASAQLEREVDLGELGIHKLRVANTKECTNGETSQTACGFVLEFADIISNQKMNTTNTNVGGYQGSNVMYNYVTDTIYNLIPADLKQYIINTKVVSGYGQSDISGEGRDENNNYVLENEKIYLFSRMEIFGNINYDTAGNKTRRLDYYNTNYSNDSYVKYLEGNGEKVPTVWWTRTAFNGDDKSFTAVGNDGVVTFRSAGSQIGVSPAFRIG